MVKPTAANTNHAAGVFYFTRESAEQVAATYANARIEKTRRGFVVVLADGAKLGPTK